MDATHNLPYYLKVIESSSNDEMPEGEIKDLCFELATFFNLNKYENKLDLRSENDIMGMVYYIEKIITESIN